MMHGGRQHPGVNFRIHAEKGGAVEVKLAVLADYANVSQNGKVNIMGIFQEVNAPSLPFHLSQMYLVLTFEAGVRSSANRNNFASFY